MDYKTDRQLVDSHKATMLPSLITKTDSLIEATARKGNQVCYTYPIKDNTVRKAFINHYNNKGFVAESTLIDEVRISWAECKTQTKD